MKKIIVILILAIISCAGGEDNSTAHPPEPQLTGEHLLLHSEGRDTGTHDDEFIIVFSHGSYFAVKGQQPPDTTVQLNFRMGELDNGDYRLIGVWLTPTEE